MRLFLDRDVGHKIMGSQQDLEGRVDVDVDATIRSAC